MAKLFLTIFLLGFLLQLELLTCSSATNIYRNSINKHDSIKADSVELRRMKAYLKLVYDNFSTALYKEIDYYWDLLIPLQGRIENSTMDEVKTAEATIISLEVLAKKLGYDPTDCTKEERKNLTGLPSSMASLIPYCSIDVIHKATSVFTGAQQVISRHIKAVDDFEVYLNKCKDEFDPAACQLITEYDIKTKLAHFPQEFGALFQEASKVIKTYEPDVIETCFLKFIIKARAIINVIVTQVSSCIRDLIGVRLNNKNLM